ncbi:MAG: hypothetical protein C0432_00260 [Candidatus Puniceispirillum sp.]|nr:hypothetical protein [Candidatus Pelagibacter sp.]MBA4282715.1 hypothetical protein [Candidatus Puniceispirillum sp.]
MTYYIKRLLLLISTISIVFFINCYLISKFPGSPLDYIQQSQNQEDSQNFSNSYHLNYSPTLGITNQVEQSNHIEKSYMIESTKLFFNYLKGDFGKSIYKHQKVADTILEKASFSFIFAAIYFVILCSLSILISCFNYIYERSIIKNLIQTLLITFNNIPVYVSSIFFILLLAEGGIFSIFKINPSSIQAKEEGFSLVSYLAYYTLPLCILLLSGVSRISLLFSQNLNSESYKSYVLQAYLKGLSRKDVVLKHIFKNKLMSFTPYLIKHFTDIIFSSSFIVEIIFSLDGLASLSYEAAITRDYPLIIACLLFYSSIAVILNFIADILIMKKDKRIKM